MDGSSWGAEAAVDGPKDAADAVEDASWDAVAAADAADAADGPRDVAVAVADASWVSGETAGPFVYEAVAWPAWPAEPAQFDGFAVRPVLRSSRRALPAPRSSSFFESSRFSLSCCYVTDT